MTQAIVVYESLFGNARTVARAIAAGLSDELSADAVDVDSAPIALGPDIRLLVVGGPNHQFGMPRPASRDEAITRFGESAINRGTGLREWLEVLQPAAAAAAAFDTRMDHPRLLRHMDHAAGTEEKLLRRLGFTLVAPAEHFYVTSATGPLGAGEADRARRWGGTLAAALAAHTR